MIELFLNLVHMISEIFYQTRDDPGEQFGGPFKEIMWRQKKARDERDSDGK
jgi:hypothetical protein